MLCHATVGPSGEPSMPHVSGVERRSISVRRPVSRRIFARDSGVRRLGPLFHAFVPTATSAAMAAQPFERSFVPIRSSIVFMHASPKSYLNCPPLSLLSIRVAVIHEQTALKLNAWDR